jgi:hypothetical protein
MLMPWHAFQLLGLWLVGGVSLLKDLLLIMVSTAFSCSKELVIKFEMCLFALCRQISYILSEHGTCRSHFQNTGTTA